MKFDIRSIRKTYCYLILIIPLILGQAQDTYDFQAPPKYSQVIDRAFQFSRGLPAEFQGINYRIAIRFMPSSGGAESQIVLLKENPRSIRLVEYTLKAGARPIIDEYNAVLQKNPKATIEEVLNHIVVEKTEQVGSDAITQLMEEFLRLSIPTKLSSDVCVDGTTYELWAQTSSNQLHASLSSCAYGENTASTPIIRWVKAVEAQFQLSHPTPSRMGGGSS